MGVLIKNEFYKLKREWVIGGRRFEPDPGRLSLWCKGKCTNMRP